MTTSCVVISMLLLALLKLTATLSVWLAHCQKMTERREGLGMSIPAHILGVSGGRIGWGRTYIRLVGTNADMRKGSGTGLPVSGCMDELTTAIQLILEALYSR